MVRRLLLSLSLVAVSISMAAADDLPIVTGVEAQPLKAQAERVAQALDYLGEPLTKEQKAALDKAIANTKGDEAVEAIQKVLDSRCLAGVIFRRFLKEMVRDQSSMSYRDKVLLTRSAS